MRDGHDKATASMDHKNHQNIPIDSPRYYILHDNANRLNERIQHNYSPETRFLVTNQQLLERPLAQAHKPSC